MPSEIETNGKTLDIKEWETNASFGLWARDQTEGDVREDATTEGRVERLPEQWICHVLTNATKDEIDHTKHTISQDPALSAMVKRFTGQIESDRREREMKQSDSVKAVNQALANHSQPPTPLRPPQFRVLQDSEVLALVNKSYAQESFKAEFLQWPQLTADCMPEPPGSQSVPESDRDTHTAHWL